jgi:RNA polymerase sigma-54 factor
MAMLQRQWQTQRQQQKADPQLLLTNRLLQMSQMELRHCLTQEMAENPALEASEEPLCGQCDTGGAPCAECPYSLGRLSLTAGTSDDTRPDPYQAGEDDLDPLTLVEAPRTLQDYLLEQLQALGGPRDERTGRYLIASIDGDGYLRCTVEEAADALTVPEEEVERVLRLVQTFDPTGVGARTLQECLLIQARALAAEPGTPPYLAALIEQYWKELTASRFAVIARRARLETAEVERTVRWLRGNLSPYPGGKYRPSWQKSGQRSRLSVRPDVIVTLNEQGELELELVKEEQPAVNVNPEYHRLWQQMRERPEAYGEAERQHIRDYVLRAQMFLKSLEDRSTILRRMAECVACEQEQYLRSEAEEDMRPLTQAQLATFLQVHESTVSRAVADKFLQLPSGRVVPFSHFFDRALSYRKLVANVVESENPAAPYSDQEISDILRRQGVQIARRTVMKYREEMNILSSRQRIRACGSR